MQTSKNYTFHNPTKGEMGLKQVIKELLGFINQIPDKKYRIIIGTDSSARGKIDFVTAIVIYRVGYGGRYFWQRVYINKNDKKPTLRQRIYHEVELSLNMAGELIKNLEPKTLKQNLEIHVDVGKNGDTRSMIKEIVGMVRGAGFHCYTKPESFGASIIADKHV